MSYEDPDAFGFLDPQDVIRGSHLIPAFVHRETQEYLPKSVARRQSRGDQDWRFYYANMVVEAQLMDEIETNVFGKGVMAKRDGELADVETSGGSKKSRGWLGGRGKSKPPPKVDDENAL
ncbi:hypothetical protein MIND_01145600 [Mycena indigotica]|uniref:Uncharacterized protein n=1 Tax=Mycena indigotica TaxID=2126181 RepID=A0A8H6VTS3_9AGAR|nr:uncharacterized protein MIND_01145600 [Mycena indigotica]KAF7293657.1 hypothetical protein MIND_01145600 [Mycena indigotica]